MTRDPNDKPSIFNTPFEDEPLPSTEDLDATRSQPTGTGVRATPSIPEPRRAPMAYDEVAPEPSSRSRMVAIAAAGIVVLAGVGFGAATLLRGPATTGATESPSATPSTQPLESDSSEPSASAEAATPVPTPAGPPSQLAVNGWATIGDDQLDVRREPAATSESLYLLASGAIVHVDEGPTVVDGANWYLVTSLGGASGWASSGPESDPALETLTAEPVVGECGQVQGPVFDTSGALAANDPLRIGVFALPASGFDDRTLAAMELLRGMGDPACFSARLGADGTPELSAELAVVACGHATPHGYLYQLVPADDDRISLADTVIEPTLIHPTLLDGGPADNRMSSNLATVMTMLANEGTNGCVNTNVVQHGSAVESHRSLSAFQCSLVELYDQYSLKLAPVSGGPTAWLKLSGSDYQTHLFQVGQRTTVNVDAGASDQDRYVYAWPQNPC